jgi:hypothetical protein
MASSSFQSILPRILTWPEEDQEALVHAALQIEAAREGVYVLTPEEERDVIEALVEAERGDFATDEEVAALFGRRIGR